MVEVQKLEVFCDFCGARATLCGDRRGRGAKTHGFCLRFLRCPRNPLRGSAWSRCKNLRFFAISTVLAQPCGNRRGRGAKTRGFATFVVRTGPRELSRGSRTCSRNRRVAGSTSQDATCILKQLAQSKLHRATCADQLAPTSLRRAPCLEQLAQLAGATCAEQLAQSNLHSATCVEQLAQTNLHRPVCAEHLAWRCLALASRVGKKERILQRWADLACDVLLSGQPWSSFVIGGLCPCFGGFVEGGVEVVDEKRPFKNGFGLKTLK